MTLHERLAEILDAPHTKKWKMAALASLVADDRRDFLYRLLELQKAAGTKWLKAPDVVLDKRDAEAHEDNEG